MIQANVSAAETLEQKKTPLIYRIHDTPSPEKMMALTDFLQTLEIPWAKGEAPRTDRFNRLLAETHVGLTPTSSTRWSCAPRCRPSTTPTTSATSA